MTLLARGIALVVAAVSLALIPARAESAAFTYDESVSGDLGGLLPAATVFEFDVGTNTVRGGFSFFAFGPSNSLDTDPFAFRVPDGAELTAVTYRFGLLTQGPISAASVQYVLDTGNNLPLPPFTGDQTIDLFVTTSPVSVFDGVLPLPRSVYALSQRQTGIEGVPQGLEPAGISVDYTWTFTVRGPLP
jgi:hypothetical protein